MPRYTRKALADGRVELRVPREVYLHEGEVALLQVIREADLDRAREISKHYEPLDMDVVLIGHPIDWAKIEPPVLVPPPAPTTIVVPAPHVHVNVERPRGWVIGFGRMR